MTSRLAATTGLVSQPAKHVKGADRYITVNFETAAPNNSVRITQQMWHR
jgi:hypothetical protein